MADTSDDFGPQLPYSGVLKTTVDFGILGRALPVRVSWFIDSHSRIAIEQIEVQLWPELGTRPEKWRSLEDMFAGAPERLRSMQNDRELKNECQEAFEKAYFNYQSEGGRSVLRVL